MTTAAQPFRFFTAAYLTRVDNYVAENVADQRMYDLGNQR
jgi:hypothetical protein